MFEHRAMILHSGSETQFKIECTSLREGDYAALAWMVAQTFSFGRVVPIPTGGYVFARYLRHYVDPKLANAIIVDDVMTTGASFLEMAEQVDGDAVGVCIFARGDRMKHPDWVTPLFMMHGSFAAL